MDPRSLWSVLLLAVALAGCTDDPTPERPSADAPSGDLDAAHDAGGPVQAPNLTVGRSWTYRTLGYWDATEQVTVGVARADESGYLFAGATEADLLDEVFWDRLHFGPTDRDLQPLVDGGPAPSRLVAFPLQDGANWTVYDVPVVARAGQVPVPGGTAPGFLVRGSDDGRRVEVDYVPSLGAVTHFALYAPSGEAAETLDLVSTGTSESWVWMERSAEVFASFGVGDPARFDPSDPAGTAPVRPPASLEVAGDDDAVLLWGLGTEGSRGAVVPPGTEPAPWTFEGAGVPAFEYAVLAPTQGAWQVTGAPGDPDGWVYLQAHAVRWVRS